MNFKQWLENEDYRGTHQAPTKDDSPLHDLTNTYPDDIYSDKGALYYGDSSSFDQQSISIIKSARGKPNLAVKIFRAVPDINKETNTRWRGKLSGMQLMTRDMTDDTIRW